MSFVKQVSSLAEFREALNKSPTKLVVVDFFAHWCGPCKVIAPKVDNLSKTFRHVTFLKVDVDASKDISESEKVTAMPTFKLYKGGQEIAKIVGADYNQLEGLTRQHAGKPEDSGSSVLTFGNHSDINEFIMLNQVNCLNQQGQNVNNIFKNDDSYLESDVDEQLIISVQFGQTVKIHSLKLVADDIAHAPKTIKLYANRLNIGFDETNRIEATQVLTLSDKDYADNGLVPLRFVKFQSVNNITLFVQDNLGDTETSKIKRIHFIGSPVETTKMENLAQMAEGRAV
ncbi:10850_t:CDS:2 [Paraglomus brasilianum]|uniref:10850_t:CDS:1 n=1 Tax=Paraglomus brasilianum TaxID=144538 RepID=A0A9N9CH45_9GLOM|nr:10850_t:CDS:2 [Paraglomus brasilianum]